MKWWKNFWRKRKLLKKIAVVGDKAWDVVEAIIEAKSKASDEGRKVTWKEWQDILTKLQEFIGDLIDIPNGPDD